LWRAHSSRLRRDNDFHNIGIGILGHHVAPLAQQAERELAQGRLEPIDTASITF
jgi:cytochrome c peroxidase